MVKFDTVIYMQQSVEHARVWYSDPYVTKCTVW